MSKAMSLALIRYVIIRFIDVFTRIHSAVMSTAVVKLENEEEALNPVRC